MTHSHDTGSGVASGVIIGLLVAIVVAFVVYIFVFGGFGLRDRDNEVIPSPQPDAPSSMHFEVDDGLVA